jgi:pimeloyl-ACP methyl ester carboxylesterase
MTRFVPLFLATWLWFFFGSLGVGVEVPRFGGGHARDVVQESTAQISILDSSQQPTTAISDGNRLQIQITLAEKSASESPITFVFDGVNEPLAACTIAANSNRCTTEAFDSLGWYWDSDGSAHAARVVVAMSGETRLGEVTLTVRPRPVVMVHGFGATWQAWQTYLGPDGYLASIGVAGYAVGDGQIPGAMNTGNLLNPPGRTNTIAENAAIVKQVIDGVKKSTGAEKVDLIAHSMGGLISRYYIDRVMEGRDVGQLIMLGTPQNGTDCAYLPASLSFYLPAALEIRPRYVQGIFNRQVTHRHGVQFYALAGIPIIEAFKSPCTSVPSDIAVSLDSAHGLPLNLEQIPLLHTDLNASAQAFEQFVRPLLQKPPSAFSAEPDPVLPDANSEAQQFTKIYHGHLDAGTSQEFIIPIEAGVTVASFALYDSSRSLDVTVTGASGKEIELDADKNGLIVIDDPTSLIYLGYGFANPKMGLWKVTLHTSPATPANGADFALAARFEGGAKLLAEATPLLPSDGANVNISARLELDGQVLAITQAQASIQGPDGKHESIPLNIADGSAQATWTPPQPGLYSIDIELSGQPPQGALPEGALIERAAFLIVEAQPPANRAVSIANLVIVLAVVAVVLLLIGWLSWKGIGKWLFRRARNTGRR